MIRILPVGYFNVLYVQGQTTRTRANSAESDLNPKVDDQLTKRDYNFPFFELDYQSYYTKNELSSHFAMVVFVFFFK